MKASYVVTIALICSLFVLCVVPQPTAYGQEVTTEPPQQQSAPPASTESCPKGKRGGAIGGIVVGSVFWWVLPMSIPVLITQTKKLKAHNRAMRDRRCQYAPSN
ncbi:MAG: hypothetical protein PVH21_06060 [Myxococcales bacterium]|jgi:hypothetical protein